LKKYYETAFIFYIKDVLAKMRHPNHFNRLEAVRALRDILHHRPEAVQGIRSEMLKRLLTLAIDQESNIREVFIETLHLALSCTGKATLKGQMDILAAHVGGALTHIDTCVQKDALRVVNLLVDTCPEFIRSSYEELLPACLSQIGQVTTPSAGNTKPKSSGRGSLSFTTPTTVRIEVLKTILGILKLLVVDSKEEEVRITHMQNVQPLYEHSWSRLHEPMSLKMVQENWRSMLEKGCFPSQWPSFLGHFKEQLMPLMKDTVVDLKKNAKLERNIIDQLKNVMTKVVPNTK